MFVEVSLFSGNIMKTSACIAILFLVIASCACSIVRGVARSEQNGSRQEQTTESKQSGFGNDGAAAEQTTANVTGTYELTDGGRSNELKVQQSARDQITVQFEGTGEFKSQAGPMANTGMIGPITLKLDGSRAILTNPDAEGCRIVLTFSDAKLTAQQNENDCGLPSAVYAGGNYRRTSSKDPFIDEEPGSSSKSQLKDANDKATDSSVKRIRFAAGSDSATVNGRISDGKPVSYVIGAGAGQSMEVMVIGGDSGDGVVVGVDRKDGGPLSSNDNSGDVWRGRLPKSGDYVITVNTVDRKSIDFAIRVTID